MVTRNLRAMNTDVELAATGADAEHRLAHAATWLAAYESRFSRFRDTSELSRLNASSRPFRASPALFRLVELAVACAQDSDGIFDPTILRSMEDAGYDRSFELLPSQSAEQRRPASRHSTWRDIHLDPATRTITLAPGAGVDLGGIGKGFAVDRVAAILGSPSLVNCGGDLYATSSPPGEAGWRVGVSDPFTPEQDLIVLTIVDQAIATSSTMGRRWNMGAQSAHHLIDPRTGKPSDTDAVQVTVAAPTAVGADYHAKVALLLGIEAGMRYLNAQPAIEGFAVRSDRTLFQSANFAQYWT